MALIKPPDLDIRNVEKLTAEALWRMVRPVTPELLGDVINALQDLLDRTESGTTPPEPLTSELTNLNPSAPLVAFVEAFCWLLAQIAYRINLLPVRDQIEFARLFVGDSQEATIATAELQFTTNGQTEVLIPAGTQVSTTDSQIVFETVEALTIPESVTIGTVTALRTVTGQTLLAPGTLTKALDQIAGVTGVTNPSVVDSGSEGETLAQYLERARNFQRRGTRLVSAKDFEEAVYEEVLHRNGIVKMFLFIQAGNFAAGLRAGYSTLVVMTATGNPVSASQLTQIRALLDEEAVVGQWVSVAGPQYVEFNVGANVKISSFTSEQAVRAAIQANLRALYAPKAGNFGRRILRSEIIQTIEGTDGVDRVEPVDPAGPILVTPVGDTVLAPYELPRLVNVTINIVP